jgi:hypothetical protein
MKEAAPVANVVQCRRDNNAVCDLRRQFVKVFTSESREAHMAAVDGRVIELGGHHPQKLRRCVGQQDRATFGRSHQTQRASSAPGANLDHAFERPAPVMLRQAPCACSTQQVVIAAGAPNGFVVCLLTTIEALWRRYEVNEIGCLKAMKRKQVSGHGGNPLSSQPKAGGCKEDWSAETGHLVARVHVPTDWPD